VITVVGSLNMDLFIETPQLPSPGETVLGRNFRRACGGKGANQAVTVARMRTPCTMVGAVGIDTFGDEMLTNLRAAGVDVSAVTRRSEAASGTALIVVDAHGQNQIVVATGANELLTPDGVRQHAELFRRSRAVVTQLETPIEAIEAALRQTREVGALTVLNPAPFVAGCETLLSLCDWVIPNEHEATRLSGIEVTSLDTGREAAKLIRNRSSHLGVLITLGAGGAWLDTPSFTGHLPGFAVEAVDTVGAGDTFIGAFVSRLVEGVAPLEAARFACAAAALAVTRRGAQAGIPTRAEVEAFLETASPSLAQ